MKKPAAALIFGISALCATAASAQNVNIRGTVTSFDGKIIAIKSREGSNLQIELPENAPVSITKPLSLGDLKDGQMVAVTTIKRASDGATTAIDVRPLSATANPSLSPYDLQPESTMTNAALEASVQSASGQELTLNYKTGTVKVLVPEGTPMSQSAPGNRADIKPGETIFVAARPGPDGKLTVQRVQVSKDGVKPTQ